MSDNKPKDDLVGKVLGQYEIVEEVGRGGMASVYRARQLSMNRIVAVKVLPRHLLHDPSFYERFEREVDVISHLEHPHIVPIYDYGQSDGIPFIAMRFLGGGSLEQTIRRGVSNLDDLEVPLRQIAQALDYAHRQGIIHRDLKPGNIMLDENNNAYLSDFGIARVLGSNMTGSMIVGTPAYMSPEQANGMPIDGRSDIYALGIVLFELITGSEPYSAETPMAVLLKHINEPIPPLRNFRQDVPAQVEDVIQKATAKNPDERYNSANDMVRAYSAALRGETAVFDKPTQSAHAHGTKAVPTPAPGSYPTPAQTANITGGFQTDPTGTAYPVGTNPSMQMKQGPSTSLLIAVVVIVLVLVGGAVAALSILNKNDKPNEPPPQAENVMPTPFLNAIVVEQPLYRITIPQAWIPPQGIIDISSGERQVHIWQNQADVYVSLEFWGVDMNTPEDFRAAIDDYERNYFSEGNLTLIDEGMAEDGTVRLSYYTTETQNPDLLPGQVDHFYFNRSPYLVVLTTYSAYSAGNTYIRTFQQILDSLRLKTQQPA